MILPFDATLPGTFGLCILDSSASPIVAVVFDLAFLISLSATGRAGHEPDVLR